MFCENTTTQHHQDCANEASKMRRDLDLHWYRDDARIISCVYVYSLLSGLDDGQDYMATGCVEYGLLLLLLFFETMSSRATCELRFCTLAEKTSQQPMCGGYCAD